MNDLELFKSQIEICDLHSNRLKMALKHIVPLIPIQPNQLNNFSEEDLGFLELMTSRFSKLQDTIGKKIFPLILKLLQEYDSRQSFIDQLHKMEKLGIIEDIGVWTRFRHTRNAISHDYPDHPELIANGLNQCVDMCKILINFWENVKEYSRIHILQKRTD